MLETARAKVARAGLEDRIILVMAWPKIFRPPLSARTAFDHVLFSYSLSMIPDWREALVAAAKALSPEGRVHIVDFGDLKSLGLARGAAAAWLRLFHVTPRANFWRRWKRICAETEGLDPVPGRYAFAFRSRQR